MGIGHWELGIGHWAWGISYSSFARLLLCPPAPLPPCLFSPPYLIKLQIGLLSFKICCRNLGKIYG